MKTSRLLQTSSQWLACAALTVSLCGCAGHFRFQKRNESKPAETAKPQQPAPPVNPVPRLALPPQPSLTNTLTELAADGEHPIPSMKHPVKVDAHSILQLQFPKFATTDAMGTASREWEPALATLRLFETTATRMEEINARKLINPTPEELKRLQKDASEVAGTAANIVRALSASTNLGLSQSDIADIVLGEHPSLSRFEPSPNGYVNLGRWLSAKLQTLHDAHHELATNQQVKVRVQAYRDSNGAKSALHVDGWDTFAEGAYQPIDKTGLRPTEPEQQRLNAERQQAEGARKLYESLATKDSALKQALKAKLQEIEKKLGRLGSQMQASPLDWSAAEFTALTNKLATLAGADAGSPAGQLLKEVVALRAEVEQVKKLIDSIRSVVETVKHLNQASPDALMFGGTSLFAQAGGVFQNLTSLAERLPGLPDRVKRIRDSLPVVAELMLEDQTRATLQSVEKFFSTLSQDFPDEARYLSGLWTAAFGSFQVAQGADAVKKPEGDWIPRTPDNLVPGRLDLKRSAVALGDLVSFRVTATNEATGVELEPVVYESEVGLMGFHGKPAVHFILARALSGPSSATQWKPNVAAAVEWHYTIRRPQDRWGKTWNWLYPGMGIHLASLDQGTDSVELGAGAIVSLWDGLLTGGFGYNFSNNSDHKYVFVGINLLSVLEQGKKQLRRD